MVKIDQGLQNTFQGQFCIGVNTRKAAFQHVLYDDYAFVDHHLVMDLAIGVDHARQWITLNT
jgi:hypothetical protein